MIYLFTFNVQESQFYEGTFQIKEIILVLVNSHITTKNFNFDKKFTLGISPKNMAIFSAGICVYVLSGLSIGFQYINKSNLKPTMLFEN